MNLYPIAGALKRNLPVSIYNVMARAANAVLAPLSFSLTTGNLRSSLKGQAVNSRGEAMPWYSWPVAKLLDDTDLSPIYVLEFGGGSSTKFFRRKGCLLVHTVESDPVWRKTLKGDTDKVSQYHDFQDECNLPFDLIVIDGIDRDFETRKAIELYSDGAAIIFDNSDFKENRDAAALLSKDFCRADFWGYPLGGSVLHCTSIFWKGNCWLWNNRNTPKQTTWA